MSTLDIDGARGGCAGNVHKGFKVIGQEQDGVVATAECPFPDYSFDTTFLYNVPSGRLVFANDFRDVFKTRVNADINYAIGQLRYSRAWADVGMIMGFTGNTMPGVYQNAEGEIRIANVEYDEDDNPIVPPDYGQKRGSICTDLWWFCAVDLDVLRRRMSVADLQTILDDPIGERWASSFIVDVEPGCYEIRVFPNVSHDDAPLHAIIRRFGEVRSLEPQSNHRRVESRMKDFETSVAVSRLTFPSIYPVRTSVLNQYFCVCGNGYDWIDGVLTSGGGDREAEGLDRLDAGEPVVWESSSEERNYAYPISEYSKLLRIPDDVREDWLGGALETIEWIIGLDPDYNDGTYNNRGNIKMAREALGRLEQRFPEMVRRWRSRRKRS